MKKQKERRLKRKVFQVDGMTCPGCEMRIENALTKLDGIEEVKAIFSNSNVFITYDNNKTRPEKIIQIIEKLGYEVVNKPGNKSTLKTAANAKAEAATAGLSGKMSAGQFVGIIIILFALYTIIKSTVGFNIIPEINQSMGYGILFVVGLLTSLHCISMCGGINLSQCISYKESSSDGHRDDQKSSWISRLKPSLLYNAGRVVSYTIIGGIVGALGAGISFTGTARGIVAIISGAFMVIMGLNMLNIFPGMTWLKKINPRIPKFFTRKIRANAGKYGPFIVGLLNGLMPCGPLQSMQLYALGTGSFVAGALSMFMFSLGTVPLMFGIGALSSVIGGKFTHKMMRASGALVIVLGIVMLSRGLALSGFPLPFLPFGENTEQGKNIAIVKGDFQIVETKLLPGSYEPITVQKGVPVKWIIKAEKKDINGCNNEIVIPEFKKSVKLMPGENLIEFTPAETGTFAYSCWMGMIRSKIKVVDDINNIDPDAIKEEVNKYTPEKVEIIDESVLPSCH